MLLLHLIREIAYATPRKGSWLIKGGKKTNFRREGVENLSSPFDFNLFLNQEDKLVNR